MKNEVEDRSSLESRIDMSVRDNRCIPVKLRAKKKLQPSVHELCITLFRRVAVFTRKPVRDKGYIQTSTKTIWLQTCQEENDV